MFWLPPLIVPAICSSVKVAKSPRVLLASFCIRIWITGSAISTIPIGWLKESSFSQPIGMVDMADPVIHMRMQNEANRTRGDFATFTEEQIAGTIRGGNQNIYPATDWYNQLFREYANTCLLYTSDAADDLLCVDLGGRRIIK